MTLKTPKDTNYAVVVVEIKTLVPLEKLDNVQATPIMGQQVIIGKDVNVGDIGLYFPVESQLSKEFLSNNNLYRDKTLNIDTEKGGYFDVKSSELKLQDEFDELNDIEICKKYVVKATRTEGTPGSKKDRTVNDKMRDKLVENQFKFHEDTSLLYKNLFKIKADTIFIYHTKNMALLQYLLMS